MSSYFKYMILQDSIESHIKSNRSLQVYHLRYSLKVAKVEVISSDVSQQTHKRSDIGETTSKKFESHLSCLCEYHKSLKSRYIPINENEITGTFFENYKNKIIRPSEREIKENYNSRSAKLRIATRNKM